jgi:two-component system, chemotaxis family, protein-glutamate methylesterase/glutaminase
MAYRTIIVIGASAGGIEALKILLAGLPATLPAAVLVVVHVAAQSPRLLASILAQAGPLPATYAEEGAVVEPGHIYVAPPDRHLLVEQGRLRVTRGPKENRFRPAIDPLFRSAAYGYGRQVIGIILSGLLDDGTVGLWAIKNRGGLAVVQEPSEALYPSMPQSALAHVAVDYQVSVTAMGALLARLVADPVVSEAEEAMEDALVIENRIALEDKALTSGLLDLGTPSLYTCPECHGVLLQMPADPLVRFRCHTGHAYTLASLLAEISESMEQTLWNTVRVLEEQVLLLGQMAQSGEDPNLAKSLAEKMQLAAQQIDLIRQMALQHAFPH